MKAMRVAGLMSGTSLDGIDVAIVDLEGAATSLRLRTVAHRSVPYPRRVREALLAVSNNRTHTAEIARLHFLLPELYAEAVKRCGVPLDTVQLAGCHGQTIFHEGEATRVCGRRVSSTLQIGDGSVLAERLGVPVISDFRPRDMAAGGQGAPLVPFLDYALFRHRRRTRVALNIGGIANVTLIPAGAGAGEVVAFDTGPGNMVVDALAVHATHGRRTFDRGGRMAARGRLDRQLLDELLADPFYRRPPPKTAGREQYGREFVERLLATGRRSEDLLATATALTAASIAMALRPVPTPFDLIVSGGGVHNKTMGSYLAAFLPGAHVMSSAEFGIDPDAKEAIAFAVLAYESWHGRPANLPSATGAGRAVVLGKLSP